jgi:hypothetical protein
VIDTIFRAELTSVFMDSVPPKPPLSALICSMVRPPSHKPLHNAIARVAACDAAVRRAVGRPPEPNPKLACTAGRAAPAASFALLAGCCANAGEMANVATTHALVIALAIAFFMGFVVRFHCMAASPIILLSGNAQSVSRQRSLVTLLRTVTADDGLLLF